MRRTVLVRATIALAAAVSLSAAPVIGAGPAAPAAHAADLTKFDPGNIITDAVLYAAGRMNAKQVQEFLDSRNPKCLPGADGTPCLKDFRANTVTKKADDRCPGGYKGARKERASTIIAKVAQGCGINPQVLLVILQKEQGLVNGSAAGLYVNRYMAATGYACPDSSGCNPKYRGFFNQVYMAAWRLKDYALNPKAFNRWGGGTFEIPYSPKPECGTAPVTMKNQATASLYNYTPYQPNAAALAAGYAKGDECSAYGNRNFYNYFTDWFGSTQV